MNPNMSRPAVVFASAVRMALAVGLISACSVGQARAQAPPQPAVARPVVVALAPAGAVQELRLKDDSTFYGRVVEFDEARVVFVTVSGARIDVPRGDIVSLRLAPGRVSDGKFLRADPNPTRLFFAPTARPLPRGETYIGVYEFVLPFVQVGVTNRFSIGGGTPLFFGGDGDRVFWVTPKLTVYDRGRTSAAVGVFQFGGTGVDHPPGIAYGVVTVGDADEAVSVGAGYAYAGENGTGIVMVAGEKRISRSVKLITENWVWQDGPQFFSGGFRFMGDRLSADLGLVVATFDGDTIGFPMVNFSYHF